MTEPINSTDLIINKDGSIFHLHLRPEEIAPIIFLVGDPDRVPLVSKYFDFIEVYKENRGFVTHTGQMAGHRVSVVSTGIGTSAVDIVINELDALVNIDFNSRLPKEKLTQLKLIRLGTSGGIFKDIKTDELILSQYALGLDGLINFYNFKPNAKERALARAVKNFINDAAFTGNVYAAQGDNDLLSLFSPIGINGITITCPGFYAPQQRRLRFPLNQPAWFQQINQFSYRGAKILNREMETAALYGLARVYGHAACSISMVMANRATGQISKDPVMAIENMISKALETFAQGFYAVKY